MSKEILYNQIKRNGVTSTLPVGYAMLDQIGGEQQSYEYVKSQQNFIDSTVAYSTSGQTVHSFTLPSDLVSDFFLQLDSDATATACPIYVGGRAVALFEIISSSGTHLKCTGEQLVQYLIWFNRKFGEDTTVKLKKLIDNGITTGSSIASATLCVPLIGPGSNGRLGRQSVPFNLGLLNSQLIIRITLEAGANLSSGSAVNFTKVRLSYTSYAMENDQKKLYNKFFSVDLNNYQVQPVSLTQNVDLQVNVQNSFDISGQKETVACVAHLVANADQATAFARMNGQIIPQLKFTVQNTDFYVHRNNFEARLLSLNNFAVEPLDSSGAYIYCIPFKPDVIDGLHLGKLHGISMNNIIPTITINSTIATGTYWLYTTAISKLQYVIEDGVLKSKY
jgi:hypothetical protein